MTGPGNETPVPLAPRTAERASAGATGPLRAERPREAGAMWEDALAIIGEMMKNLAELRSAAPQGAPDAAEEAPPGQVVAVLNLSGAESDKQVFALVDEQGERVLDDRFELLGNQILLKAGAELAADTVHELRVLVADSSGNSFVETVHVTASAEVPGGTADRPEPDARADADEAPADPDAPEAPVDPDELAAPADSDKSGAPADPDEEEMSADPHGPRWQQNSFADVRDAVQAAAPEEGAADADDSEERRVESAA